MDLDYSRLTPMVLTQCVHCVHRKPGRQQQKELKTGTEIQNWYFSEIVVWLIICGDSPEGGRQSIEDRIYVSLPVSRRATATVVQTLKTRRAINQK